HHRAGVAALDQLHLDPRLGAEGVQHLVAHGERVVGEEPEGDGPVATLPGVVVAAAGGGQGGGHPGDEGEGGAQGGEGVHGSLLFTWWVPRPPGWRARRVPSATVTRAVSAS